jgi:aspartate kinase
MIKVLKFGGSSLASGETFAKVKKIVEADPSRAIVVVSAPGKRFSGDTKVTDLLYILHAHIKYNAPYNDIYEKIKERYREIYYSCKLQQDLETELVNIEANLNKKTSVDYIVSRGEYLNARLMAEYLGYKFVDSADWLVFNYNGKVNFGGTSRFTYSNYHRLSNFKKCFSEFQGRYADMLFEGPYKIIVIRKSAKQ